MSHKTGPPFPANAVAIHSSAIRQLAYDEQHAVLHVAFHDGAAYQYLSVPLNIYRELLHAESIRYLLQPPHSKRLSPA